VGRKEIGKERRKIIGGIYFLTIIPNYAFVFSFLSGVYVTWHIIGTTAWFFGWDCSKT
jgi:hypothetical protein